MQLWNAIFCILKEMHSENKESWKKLWTFLIKFVFGSDIDKAIPKLFFMYYRTEQMSKYVNVEHTQKNDSQKYRDGIQSYEVLNAWISQCVVRGKDDFKRSEIFSPFQQFVTYEKHKMCSFCFFICQGWINVLHTTKWLFKKC